MSGTPLDRIRREAGVVGHPSRNTVRGTSQIEHHRAVGLDAILAARRGGSADLREFRLPAAIGVALAVATAFGHLRAFEWSARMASDDDLFVYQWLVNVLSFGCSQTWAPVVAAFALLGLAVCVLWTSGLRSGQLSAVVALGVSLAGAGVAAVPLVAAAVVAVVALAVAIALFVALVILGLLLVFALLSSAFE